MTEIFVVTYQISGFAKEDQSQTIVSGVYTDEGRANINRAVVSGKVTKLILDAMPPGIFSQAKEFGLIK